MTTLDPALPEGTTRARMLAAARCGFAAAALAAAGAAQAHFQLLYTPETALSGAQALHFVMVFSHPAHGGPTMQMGAPEAFFVVSQRGDDSEPVKTDLKSSLKPIEWQSKDGPVHAYEASLPRNATRSLGDYVFVFQPAPYLEKQEDKFIQQFTKTVVNVGGVPGNWAEPVGLPTEIVPLDKPYANWVGGVFRAVVLSDGKPVPHAEIEIEYLNHEPQIEHRRFDPEGKVTAPQESFSTLSVRADAMGQIIIGLPKAGWWGICALNLDDGLKHEGKELSLDAVLWLKATDMVK